MRYNKIVALKYAQHFCKVANNRLKHKKIFCDDLENVDGTIKLYYDDKNIPFYFAAIDISHLELLVISQFRHFDLTKDNIDLIYECLLTDIKYASSIIYEQGN